MYFKNITEKSARRYGRLAVIAPVLALGFGYFLYKTIGEAGSSANPYPGFFDQGSGLLLVSMGPSIVVALILFTVFSRIASTPKRYKKFLEGGTKGKATVEGISVSGTRINNVPVLHVQLEVQTPGEDSYKTTVKELGYPGTIPAGGTYECVVHPRKKSKVMVLFDKPLLGTQPVQRQDSPNSQTFTTTFSGSADIGQAISSAISSATTGNFDMNLTSGAPQTASIAELLSTGKPGTGSIVQTSDTKLRSEEGDKMFTFVLDVKPDNGDQEFRAMMIHRVPDAVLSRTVPGTQVRVAYDPINPNNSVAIDWDRPL